MTEIFLDENIDRRAVPTLKTHPLVLGQDGRHLCSFQRRDGGGLYHRSQC